MDLENRLKVKKCYHLVWTTEKPTDNIMHFLRSPVFRIQGCQFHLEIILAPEIYIVDLVPKDRKIPRRPFCLTTMLRLGTNYVSVETRTLTGGTNNVWTVSISELSRRFLNFSSLRDLRFEFIFDGHSGFEPWLEADGWQLSEINNSTGNDSKLCDEDRSSVEKLSQDFGKLLDRSSSHDVQLKCGDLTFSAHKSVLIVRSEVFEAMLNSDMKEGRSGLLEIQDMDGKSMQEFLQYLYTGKLQNVDVDRARRLYEAGDKYAVEDLKSRCSKFLSKNLKQDNACSALTLADRHSDEELKSDAIVYIVKEGIPLMDDTWPDFCRSHSQLAIEVLNHGFKQNRPK